ncbi:MAG: PEP-CTERM sorting domain-containing protein [Planctomycetes bacterium]|nr:PEP-CTERM sorting domain-containing protein [Planctomycetota bacterium]
MGIADPMIDYALFSLSPGSPSLMQYGLSPSDIFFTDFSGCFWLYALGSDLGLLSDPGANLGDNVDALEVLIYGDLDLDGDVDIFDWALFQPNYGTPFGATWQQGDLDGDGDVDIFDFALFQPAFKTGTGPEPIPEPMTIWLMTAAATSLLRRKRLAA